MRPWPIVLAALLVSPEAAAETPWEQLFGRKPNAWHDPAGRFSLDLPLGWKAHPGEATAPVSFVRTRAEDRAILGQVEVEIRPLPPDVAPKHLDSHVQSKNKKAAPGYAVLGRQSVKVGGHDGVRTHFRYRALGNVQLSREVVQTVFVAGERGYVVTLETPAGGRGRVWPEFELMMKGFSIGAAPVTNPTRRAGGRRKVRAGEMINPDAVGY
ncbi:MAG: hypothetical protein AAFZ18_36295 [Myxococcota bacterium]